MCFLIENQEKTEEDKIEGTKAMKDLEGNGLGKFPCSPNFIATSLTIHPTIKMRILITSSSTNTVQKYNIRCLVLFCCNFSNYCLRFSIP